MKASGWVFLKQTVEARKLYILYKQKFRSLNVSTN